MRSPILLAVLLLCAAVSSSSAHQFRVFYYLPKGNSPRLEMTLEAPDPGTAAKIFSGLLPRARISEVKRVTH